jgi:hypothetical protein
MASSDSLPHAFSGRRWLGLTLRVWGAGCIVMTLLCGATGQWGQWSTGGQVGLVSLLIAGLAHWPLRRFARDLGAGGEATRFVAAALLASSLRLSLTLMLVVVLDKTETAPRQTIGLWAIFWYSLLMAAELVPVATISTGGRLFGKRSIEEPGPR